MLAALIALLVCSALYPFHLDLPYWATNDATRGPRGELVFGGSGLAWTTRPPPWLDEAIASSSLAVDLRAQPDPGAAPYPAVAIFSVAGDEWHTNLAIEQELDNLLVRLRQPGSTAEGVPILTVFHAFAGGVARDVGVRIADDVLQVSVDGVTAAVWSLGDDALAGWNPTYRLGLGNEWVGTRGWQGTLRTAVVEVGGIRADLLAGGEVVLPDRWLVVPERLRQPPDVHAIRTFGGPLLHGLVYAVLVLFSVVRSKITSRRALLSAMGLSIVLGLGKTLMAGRHPSAIDAGIEVLGATLGAIVGSRWLRRHCQLDLAVQVPVRG